MMKMLIWDESDSSAHVAVGFGGKRYVVWPDGALSGYGDTTYYEGMVSAKTAAALIECDLPSIQGEE